MEPNYKNILTPTLTKMDDGTIRIIFSMNEEEMVCLYYEVAKKGWTNKPILSNKWRCVDAKVMNPNIYEDGTISPFIRGLEPKDLVGWGQELISISSNILPVEKIGNPQN